MNLVGNSIPGSRKKEPVLCSNALKVSVVIGIAKIGLDKIVINITYRELCPDLFYPHCLQLKIGHCPGGVLGQSLINP